MALMLAYERPGQRHPQARTSPTDQGRPRAPLAAVYEGLWFSPLRALDAFGRRGASGCHRRGRGAAPGDDYTCGHRRPRPLNYPERLSMDGVRRSAIDRIGQLTMRNLRHRGQRAASSRLSGSGPSSDGGSPTRAGPDAAAPPEGTRVAMSTLWHGRFEGARRRALAFTESLPFDRRLAGDDMRPRAHVRGLVRRHPHRRGTAPCWPPSTGSRGSLARDEFALRAADEDVHTPSSGGSPSWPARGRQAPHRPSRNDQVATALRLFTKRELAASPAGGRPAAGAAGPRRGGRRRLPARLHPPPTGPAGAAGPPPARPRLGPEPRRRPTARLPPAPRRVPAGAGALAGSSLPSIPTAGRDLGFAAGFENSLDAASDRDFVAEALFALACSASTCPGWARRCAVGHRRVRVRAARRCLRHGVVDAASEEEPRHRRAGPGQGRPADRRPHRPLATLKGLPLAYNRDLQEDKEPLFDAVDQVAWPCPGPERPARHAHLRPRPDAGGRRLALRRRHRPGRAAGRAGCPSGRPTPSWARRAPGQPGAARALQRARRPPPRLGDDGARPAGAGPGGHPAAPPVAPGPTRWRCSWSASPAAWTPTPPAPGRTAACPLRVVARGFFYGDSLCGGPGPAGQAPGPTILRTACAARAASWRSRPTAARPTRSQRSNRGETARNRTMFGPSGAPVRLLHLRHALVRQRRHRRPRRVRRGFVSPSSVRPGPGRRHPFDASRPPRRPPRPATCATAPASSARRWASTVSSTAPTWSPPTRARLARRRRHTPSPAHPVPNHPHAGLSAGAEHPWRWCVPGDPHVSRPRPPSRRPHPRPGP